MHITIANLTTTLDAAKLQSVVRAVAQQVREDFEPEWGRTATLASVTTNLKDGKLAPVQGLRSALIYVGDSHADPTTGVSGAFGYHDDTHRGVPYGFIYLDVCKQYGEDWTVTLSHEVLELLADPDAARAITGPAPGGGKGLAHYDLEVCDPTQGDTYEIGNVRVSNFVGRAYFGLRGGSGKTNFLDLELAPFGVRPGGYFQYAAADGRRHQVDGPDAERRKAAKKAIEHVRRTTQRERRLSGS